MKRDTLSERSKGQLIGKRQAHLCVLQHVIEAEVLDQIFRAMDLLVRVLELRLDDECRWVAEAAGRSVVRTGVATLGLDVGNVAVLGRWVSIREKSKDSEVIGSYGGDDLLDESGKTLIHVIDNHTHGLLLTSIESTLDIARHILLQHGLDFAQVLLVLRVDSLGAEQPTLLG